MKKIIYFLLALALMVVFSYSVFCCHSSYKKVVYAKTGDFHARYQRYNQPAYLYMSSIIDPSVDNLSQISLILAEDGEFQVANVLALVLRNEDLYQKIAEEAALRQNVEGLRFYKDLITSAKYEELNTFIDIVQGRIFYSDDVPPLTNPGKLLFMVYHNDFNTYNIDGKLGEGIDIIQGSNTSVLAKRISFAQMLTEHGLDRLALQVVEEITLEYPCLTEVYTIEAEINWTLNKGSESLRIINLGLACNPNDEEMLELAIYFAKESGDISKANSLSKRLFELNKIAK
jgi:hypothetical protein